MAMFVSLIRARNHEALTDLSDSRLTELLTAACATAERYCHRTFIDTADARTETYDGDGTRVLVLNELPIDSVEEVVIRENGVEVYAWDDTTDPTLAATFDLDIAAGILSFKDAATGAFLAGRANVDLAYTYTSDAGAFAAVSEWVISEAARLQRSTGLEAGISGEKLGDYEVNYFATSTARGDQGDALRERFRPLDPYVDPVVL